MKINYWRTTGCFLLIVFRIGYAQESPRDPFLRPAMPTCVAEENNMADWQLLGMVGNAGNWQGWGTDNTGQWLRFIPGEILPQQEWLVDKIDTEGVELVRSNHATDTCAAPERIKLLLRSQEE